MWIADLGNGNYKNPVLYADYSDPDAIRVGDDYFMVASSFCNAPALPLLHSKDLVNWKVVNYVLDKVPEFRYLNPIHGCGVWAPSIRYHEGTYYVCFPMPDEGIYMTTTKDPLGKWSEPVNIRPGAGWIDPCPFWDEDGKAYLAAGVAKSRIGYKSVLYITEMQPDGMGLIGEEVKVFDGNTNGNETVEGPKMYKKDGWYYIFAPAGGVKTGWQLVLRSKNVFGPYEHKIVMRQGDTAVNGPHQGAWVDTVTGEDWFLHFQDVFAAGRITHLQPMSWEDGWPIIGIKKEDNDYGEPVMEYKKPDIGKSEEELKDNRLYPVCEPDTTDEFEGDKLGLQWQWNANPDKDWYELDGSVVRLQAIPSSPIRPVSDYRNLLLQKWPAPEFSCVTKMSMANLEEGDRAGIVSLGVEYAAMAVKKDKDGYVLEKVIGTQDFDCNVAYADQKIESIPLKISDFADEKKDVYFLYEVKCVSYGDMVEDNITLSNIPKESITLSYSMDGKEYKEAFTIMAKAGRWVGVKNGVFCNHNNTIDGGGYAAVDYVRYQQTRF